MSDLEHQLRQLLSQPGRSPREHLSAIGHELLAGEADYPDFIQQCRAAGVASDLFERASADLQSGQDRRQVWDRIRQGLWPYHVGGFPASAEQRAVLAAAQSGDHLWIRAGAGASKTSTLAAMAEIAPKRTLYLAFNRGIAEEARQRFPSSVECKTLHALALKYLPDHLRHAAQDMASPQANRDLLNRLNQAIGQQWPLGSMTEWLEKFDGKAVINRNVLRQIVNRAWDVWLTQTDGMLKLEPLARCCADLLELRIVTPKQLAFLAQLIEQSGLPRLLSDAFNEAWDGLMDGAFDSMGFGEVLKVFGLSGPVLPIERLLVDEAQDLNPLMLSIIQRHIDAGVQTVMVGDSAQAIYGWNGSINAMEIMLPRATWQQLDLSVTFRCPPQVVELANSILAKAGHELKLSAFGQGAQQTSGLPTHAVICRTNAGCVDQIARLGLKKQKVFCPRKPDLYLLWQLFWLKIGAHDKVEHADLKRFSKWSDLGQSVKSGLASADIAAAYRIIDNDAGDFSKKLKQIKSVMVDSPAQANTVVLTAHAAKGLEFEQVDIAGDFADALLDVDPMQKAEELNILYVAVTRAMQRLGGPNDPKVISQWMKGIR